MIQVSIGQLAQWLLTGVNVVMLFLAIRRLARLELMVETMWTAFLSGQFVERRHGTAHNHGDAVGVEPT